MSIRKIGTNRVFYLVVLGIALTGSAQVAVSWLHWPPVACYAAVAAVELGAVTLSVHGDKRRRKGERAIAARLLSAAVAVGGVAMNLLGHQHRPGQAAFFAGMSALGYLVWLIDSGARRRDQLRAEGRLPQPRQTYSLADWLTKPGLVIEARHLADETPTLGRAGSLRAATAARVEAERTAAADAAEKTRRAAIAAVVHRDVAATKDKLAADLAVAALNFEAIGAGIHSAVDNAAIAGRYAAALGAAVAGSVAVPAAVEGAPRAAQVTPPEVLEEAPVSPASVPLTGDVLPAQGESFKPLPRPVRAAMARAAMAADPTLPQPAIAAGLGVKPRTLRNDLAGDSGSFPVVTKSGKDAADKGPKNGRPFGFGETEMKS